LISARAIPKPNCTEDVDVGTIELCCLGRRVVEGRFDSGSMASDGGVMLLGEVDRKHGLPEAAARCIADLRSPLLIKHGVRDMLRQREYGLSLGLVDLNDHGALRCDVAMQMTVGVALVVVRAWLGNPGGQRQHQAACRPGPGGRTFDSRLPTTSSLHTRLPTAPHSPICCSRYSRW